MNNDDFIMADHTHVARATMALVNANQDEPPHVQMHAATALFLLACERFGVRPTDAFEKANNLMNHAEGPRPEFRAIRQYMENEF